MAKCCTVSIMWALAIIASVFITGAHGLRVSSFNIKRFGARAMNDPVRSAHIVNILKNFDLVFIIELNDIRNTTIPLLLDAIERKTHDKWDFSVSDRLGRTRYYMEQYLYIYRTKKVKVLKEYQVIDTTYIRAPYAILIEYTNRGKNKQVAFMGIHAEPRNVIKELSKLNDTIKHVYTQLGMKKSVLITMGDFNADCAYLSNKAEKRLDIFKTDKFHSFIPDEWDTAVSLKSNCAYDRIVVYPRGKQVPKKVSVFNLEDELHITNAQAQNISDHYPIRFYLW